MIKAIMAFWTCNLFSASSKTGMMTETLSLLIGEQPPEFNLAQSEKGLET